MVKKRKAVTASEIGRRGGRANSAAQNAARKRNAQRAGRPRRVCVNCGERVFGGHVDRKLDVSCGRHAWRWQQKNEPPSPLVDVPQLLADVLLGAAVGPELEARLTAAIAVLK